MIGAEFLTVKNSTLSVKGEKRGVIWGPFVFPRFLTPTHIRQFFFLPALNFRPSNVEELISSIVLSCQIESTNMHYSKLSMYSFSRTKSRHRHPQNERGWLLTSGRLFVCQWRWIVPGCHNCLHGFYVGAKFNRDSRSKSLYKTEFGISYLGTE